MGLPTGPPAKATQVACALAVGGLDPGGGAGVVADLRAFAAAGAFGCAVVALSTVQSTAGLRSARALPAREVVAQVAEVLRHQRVRAVKVGALGSAANVRALAALFGRHRDGRDVPVVVDTPMRATRGSAPLLARGAVAALRDELLPRATLVTVNADEAGVLLGEPVRTVGEAHDAARALVAMGARAALVKGGHIAGPSAIDVLAVGRDVVELRAKRLPGHAHGTGCTLASLVAGRLAFAPRPVQGEAIVAATRWAKAVHHRAFARAVDVGGPRRVLVF